MNKLNNNEAIQMNTVMPTMKKSLLALAVAGTMAMSGGVYAGALTGDIAATDTLIANSTTIDAAAVAGHASKNIVFDMTNGTANPAVLGLVISGAGTVDLGGITTTDSVAAGDRASMTVGSGTGAAIVIVNGAIVGDDGNANADSDLDILVTVSTGNDDSSLSIYGDTDASTGVVLTGGSGTGTTTLTIGDGTNAADFAGTLDMGSAAASVSVLNVAASSIVSGAIDLSSSGTNTTTTINLAAGSSITGAITDTASGGTAVINVNGSATIGSSTNVLDMGTSTGSIAIDDTMTLTLAGTGTVTTGTITLTGTTAALTVSGAKTITGNIVGAADADGIVTFSDNVIVAGQIGTSTTVGVGSVRVASGKTLTINSGTAADGIYTAGNLDADAAGTRGGTVTLNAGAATAHSTVGTTQISLIDGTTKLTAVNVTGGVGGLSTDAGTVGAVGGASSATFTGASDITTLLLTGGVGGAGLADDTTTTLGGAGGASTATFTAGLTSTTTSVIGGKGGAGGADSGTEALDNDGGVGGASTLDLNLVAGTAQNIGTLNITGGAGGNEGLGDEAGEGGAGGAALATIAGDVTGNIVLTVGATGTENSGADAASAAGVGGTASVTFDGATAQTVIGNITAGADDTGTINVTNDLTITGNVGLVGATADIADLKISDGKSLTITGTVDVVDLTLGSSTGTGTQAVTFKGATVVINDLILFHDAANATRSITFDASNNDISATVAISTSTTDTGDTNNISFIGGTTNTTTYNSAIVTADEIDSILVGSSTQAGKAELRMATAVTAYTLNDTAGSSTLSFNATEGAKAIAGTINGTAAGKGTLSVYDDDADAAADTFTFAGVVGGTGSLKAVNIGNTTQGGSATFSAAVSATDILLTGGNDAAEDANATFAAAVTATTITLDDTASGGSATMTATGDVTIAGNIVAASDGEGVLTLQAATDNDTTTFSGNIGTDTVRLKELNITSVTTVSSGGDFDGDVYADAITLTAHTDTSGEADAVFAKNVSFTTLTLGSVDSTDYARITFDGSTAQTVTGLIVGETAGDGGDILVSNTAGSVTFASAIGLDADNELNDIVLNVGSTTTFNSTVESATMTSNGTVTFEDAVTLTGSTLMFGNGSTIVLGSGIVAGETVISTADSSTTFNTSATVTLPQTFNTGTITLVDSASTVAGADAALLTLNTNVLATYAAAANASDSSKLDIVATAKSAATLATELSIDAQNATALQNANTSLTTGDTAGHAAMNTVLIAGGVALQNATEQMQPDAGAANGAALAAVGAVNNVINSRNTNTRVAFNSLGKQSGVSTGDAANDIAVWAQIFGSNATQEKLGNVDGYDADNMGVVVGWETEKSGDLMGFSMSYSDTDVDGKSAAKSHTDTTAVQASVYGTYNDSTDYMFGYASGNNDSARSITFGGLNLTAKGSYHSDIVMAKVGHSFDSMGAFTPRADLSMTSISNEGYTETGANNLNLTVASSDNTIVTARVGGEFATKHVGTDGSMMIPRASVMFGYDLANDGASTTANYAGGSTFVTTGADPKKASVEFGVGVDHVSDDTTISADFNANVRDSYDSMTGSLTFKSKF
jgi:fibronectin-binding autotransporter adhesin